MKKFSYMKIMIIFLILSLSLTLFACNTELKEKETEDNPPPKPPSVAGLYFAKGLADTIDTFTAAANEFKEDGVIAMSIKSKLALTQKGITNTYDVNAKSAMGLFKDKDGNFSKNNGLSIDFGQNDNAIFRFVYDNDKFYLDIDGQKVEIDLFNIAEAIGGKDEIFKDSDVKPADGESTKPDESLSDKVRGLGGLFNSIFKESDANTYNAETNTINVSSGENFSSLIVPTMLGMIDQQLGLLGINIQERIDKVIQNLSKDGKFYYLDLMPTSFSQKYIHHITFDTAAIASKAIAEYEYYKDVKFPAVKAWKEATFKLDEKDNKSIYTSIKVNADGTIPNKFSTPTKVEALYVAQETSAMIPSLDVKVMIDLDSSNRLESIAFTLDAPKTTFTVKAIEDVTYSQETVKDKNGKDKIIRSREITFAANFDGTAKETKEYSLGGIGIAFQADIKINKDIKPDEVLDKDKYKKSNLINADILGGISLEKAVGGFTNYEYALKANLNPLVFSANDVINKISDIKYTAKTLKEKNTLIDELKKSLAAAGYFDLVIKEVKEDGTKVDSARAFFNPTETKTNNVYISLRGQKYILDIAAIVDAFLQDKNNYPTNSPVAFADVPLGDMDIISGLRIVDILRMCEDIIKVLIEKLPGGEFDGTVMDKWCTFLDTALDNVIINETDKTLKIKNELFNMLIGNTSPISDEKTKNILSYIQKQMFNEGLDIAVGAKPKYISMTLKNPVVKKFACDMTLTIGKKVIDEYSGDSVKNIDYLKDIKPIGESR